MFVLSNSLTLPAVGLGCAFFPEECGGRDKIIEVIEKAFDVGYRHFDSAATYHSEEVLGEALRNRISAGVITRKDVIITTKVWGTSARRLEVRESLEASLARLGFDHVDLFLIHWPVALKKADQTKTPIPVGEDGEPLFDDTDYLETWTGLEDCLAAGLTRNIGVSNFSERQLTRLLANSTTKPVCNQVEVNMFFQNEELFRYCKSVGVQMVGYSPYGKGGTGTGGKKFQRLFDDKMLKTSVFDNEQVKEIAKTHDVTAGQVALRYQIQRGIVVIPKSTNPNRLAENLKVDFDLTSDEMKVLHNLDQNARCIHAEWFAKSKYYPFGNDHI